MRDFGEKKILTIRDPSAFKKANFIHFLPVESKTPSIEEKT
jgi:hypothetical protein